LPGGGASGRVRSRRGLHRDSIGKLLNRTSRPGFAPSGRQTFREQDFPDADRDGASRYTTELRWQLGVPKREDLTPQLWLDAIREDLGFDPAAGEQKGS
jgi:hypothetical protein